jgi:50S ribosomal subunit-associated GTPase HflX
MLKSMDLASRERLARLFSWLDERLALFEQSGGSSLAGGKKAGPAQQEKEARALMSLIRVYEKLLEMKERLDERSEGGAHGGNGPGSIEADAICRELAGRIERLQKQAAAEKAAGEPERK